MWKSIDCKSLVIGGLLALLVLSAVGAVPWLPDDTFGRFTIATNTGYAFVLDSATGQVWSFYAPGPSEYTGAIIVARPHDPEEFFAPKLDLYREDPNSPVE
jgi:hypothetical protein